MKEKNRCDEYIYKKDTYRYSGRGKTGFTMHYRKQRCSRKAIKNGKCWQHKKDRYAL